jgi:hypothetical protein
MRLETRRESVRSLANAPVADALFYSQWNVPALAETVREFDRNERIARAPEDESAICDV